MPWLEIEIILKRKMDEEKGHGDVVVVHNEGAEEGLS